MQGQHVDQLLKQHQPQSHQLHLIEIGGEVISGLRTHYGTVEHGELLALVGSGGTLEVSVRSESAAARLGVGRGAKVSLRAHRD